MLHAWKRVSEIHWAGHTSKTETISFLFLVSFSQSVVVQEVFGAWTWNHAT